MKYRWSPAPDCDGLCHRLAQELKLSPLLARCLINRGYEDTAVITRFLEPRLRDLADPFLLPDMEAAVERLWQARQRGEPLVVFGDYDVDGVSATALLQEVLTALGWKVEVYLPHRMEEGYGLSRDSAENCLAQFPVSLLLAVDCGSNAVETVAWLRQQGVEVVILDHHQVTEPAPQARALVNPQRSAPSASAFGPLCSVGLAFKLAHALVKRGRQENLEPEARFDIRPWLDLVALGTIADLVPLTGENRILVTAGLQRLNETTRPGLVALRQVAGIDGPIGGYEVGFQLAPRLNAAGRLEDALQSLRLLLASDLATAQPLAQQLDTHNRERQTIERTIVEEVLATVRTRFDPARDYVLVEGQAHWHVGVVGIVASRVLKEFYRPTIILGGNGGEWRGSGRSIEGFDLAAALRECDDLLRRHGGHAMAAGLSLDPEQVTLFRDRLNTLAQRLLRPEDLQPRLRLDAEVAPAELTLDQIRELERLQQTGMGNPSVQLCMRNLTLARPARRIGRENQHLKLWVTDGTCTQEAVWWRAGDRPLPTGRFDLAFQPKLNDYRGRITVQLSVLDWRPASG